MRIPIYCPFALFCFLICYFTVILIFRILSFHTIIFLSLIFLTSYDGVEYLDEEKTIMFDLAGKRRNSVAPDLPEYIMERDYVSAALRTARDLDADEADWIEFVKELKKRKG